MLAIKLDTLTTSIGMNNLNYIMMGKKGRPKGSSIKERLISDPLIAPYEVLFDTTNKQFILYNTSTGNNEGYYVSLPLLLKAIMKTKYMPQNGDNNVYTLREYIKGMSDIRDELEALLRPTYHYMK